MFNNDDIIIANIIYIFLVSQIWYTIIIKRYILQIVSLFGNINFIKLFITIKGTKWNDTYPILVPLKCSKNLCKAIHSFQSVICTPLTQIQKEIVFFLLKNRKTHARISNRMAKKLLLLNDLFYSFLLKRMEF